MSPKATTTATNATHACPAPLIIVHGGACKLPTDLHIPLLDGVKRAAIRGYRVLLARLTPLSTDTDNDDHQPNYFSSPDSVTLTHAHTHTHFHSHSHSHTRTRTRTRNRVGKPHPESDALCLDAVEAAVRQLESDELFEAGRGSCLTREGTVEMDAAVMSGCSGLRRTKAGCVGALSRVRHPVSAARAVARHGKQVFMVGPGCEQFLSTEMGVKLLRDPSASLVTQDMYNEWNDYRSQQYHNAVSDFFTTTTSAANGHTRQRDHKNHDTVGAVVIDGRGNIACATSTGGITGKRPGRVGDSPVVGSGLYCLSGTGAAVATGHGESILRAGLCKHVLDAVSFRQRYRTAFVLDTNMRDAVGDALDFMAEVTNDGDDSDNASASGGGGGVVAIHVNGEWTAQCSTPHMPWACIDRDGIVHAGLHRGEDISCGHYSTFDYQFEDSEEEEEEGDDDNDDERLRNAT